MLRQLICSAVCLAALAASGCETTQTLQPIGPTQPIALTPQRMAAVTRAFSYVLKDPESMRIPAIEARVGRHGTVYLCGLVNSKNSFGGYTGPQMFYGGGQGSNFNILYIGADQAMTAYIYALCRNAGFQI